jgi:hypothetical protein
VLARRSNETGACPLRVTLRPHGASLPWQDLLRWRTSGPVAGASGLGHVWTAPGWQGVSSRRQDWSEQPCVRPVSAVHMTAGHNALRGSANSARLGGPNMVSSRMLSIIERRPDLMDARAPSKRVNWDSGCKSVSRSDTSPCQVFALSRSAAGGVGCSTETGSDAGKVSLRASSSACSWCVRSRSSRALLSR